jgi:hypothetical protein
VLCWRSSWSAVCCPHSLRYVALHRVLAARTLTPRARFLQKYSALKTRLDALTLDEQMLRLQLTTLQKELGVACTCQASGAQGVVRGLTLCDARAAAAKLQLAEGTASPLGMRPFPTARRCWHAADVNVVHHRGGDRVASQLWRPGPQGGAGARLGHFCICQGASERKRRRRPPPRPSRPDGACGVSSRCVCHTISLRRCRPSWWS